MRRYRRSRRIDFSSALVAARGVLVAGPLIGLLVAVSWAILGLVYRSSRVTVDVMGKVPAEKAAWGALENHPERDHRPRHPGPPGERVTLLGQRRTGEGGCWEHRRRHPDTQAVVLDLESTDQLEITSSDMLAMLLERLRARGVDLYFVRVRFQVRTVLGNTGMRAALGEDHLWHSISQGVRAAREAHGLKRSGPSTRRPGGHTTSASYDHSAIQPQIVIPRSMELTSTEDLAAETSAPPDQEPA